MKALLLALLLPLTAFAADTNSIFYVRVLVGGIETNSVASYVKRELRGLNDVRLDDRSYRVTLSVVVAPLKEEKTNVVRGYVASWVVAINEDGKDVLSYHTVQIGNSLRGMCEGIATQFDTAWLEPSRKEQQSSTTLPLPRRAKEP